MIWKKKSFSYIMWIFYVALALGGIYAGAWKLCAGRENQVLSSAVASGVIFLAGGAVTGLVYFFGRHDGRLQYITLNRRLLETVLLAVFLGVGIFLRIQNISSIAIVSTENPYYEYALVEEGRQIPQIAHGIVYVYLQLLHLVFLLFGNKLMAGIWLQFVLQYLGLLCLYAAVRKLSGVPAAAIMLFFACTSPYMAEEALTMSPRMLHLLLYGLALFLVADCVASSRKDREFSLVTGFAIAGMTYLDASGITLFLILAGGFLIKAPDPEGTEKNRLIKFILCMVGAVIGFVLVFVPDASASGKEFTTVLEAWCRLYMPRGIRTSFFSEMWSGRDIVPFVALSFGIYSFWRNKTTEKLSVWTFAALPLIGAVVFQMLPEETDGGLWLYLFAAIMTGSGIAQYFCGDPLAKQGWESVIEEIERMEEGLADGEEPMHQAPNETLRAEERPAGEPGRVVTVTVRGETRQVKLLDNPLPLPRQHEHKPMDYGLQEPESYDGYDYFVAEDDDFDI